MISVELGREIAEGIPGARFVEFPGKDHLLPTTNVDEIIDVVAESGCRPIPPAWRRRFLPLPVPESRAAASPNVADRSTRVSADRGGVDDDRRRDYGAGDLSVIDRHIEDAAAVRSRRAYGTVAHRAMAGYALPDDVCNAFVVR